MKIIFLAILKDCTSLFRKSTNALIAYVEILFADIMFVTTQHSVITIYNFLNGHPMITYHIYLEFISLLNWINFYCSIESCNKKEETLVLGGCTTLMFFAYCTNFSYRNKNIISHGHQNMLLRLVYMLIQYKRRLRWNRNCSMSF